MLMRRVSSKDKIPNGLLRTAMASGVAVGLATASLGGIGTANGTCIGLSGIDIGDGSTSAFGSFALVLGDGTAESIGFLTGAIATGTNTSAFSNGVGSLSLAGGEGSEGSANGILNLAIAGLGFAGPLGVGPNLIANAGAGGADLANLAINLGAAETLGQSQVFAGSIPGVSPGAFNLGANLFGTAGPQPLNIVATGLGSSGINVTANRSTLTSAGVLNNTTNLGAPFTFPQGSDSNLSSTGNLGVAFNYQGFLAPDCSSDCGNNVNVTGPLALAGSINQVNETVVQNGFGININNFLTPASSTNVLAASQPNKFVPKIFATGTGNTSGSQLSGSLTKAGKQFSSSLNQTLKKLSDSVNNVTKNVTGGFAGGTSSDK